MDVVWCVRVVRCVFAYFWGFTQRLSQTHLKSSRGFRPMSKLKILCYISLGNIHTHTHGHTHARTHTRIRLFNALQPLKID